MSKALFATAKPAASGSGARAHAAPMGFQANLAIREPGDRFEREADRIAEHVLRTPAFGAPLAAVTPLGSGLQRKCDCGTCSSCQANAEQARAPVQLKRLDATSNGGGTAPRSVHEVLRAPGEPLDAATRAFMEPRFGHDFSRVRVHADASAAASAKELRARAYTVGSHVAFAPNQFSPATTEGRRLLAHELSHVLQQQGGVTAIQRDSDDDDAPPPPRAPLFCPGGGAPYQGVCLTEDILAAMPAANNDPHVAMHIVDARSKENKLQARVQEKYAKFSGEALSDKIADIRKYAGEENQGLRRLEQERNRRRALPISTPTKVDNAIAMLEEAWSLAEKEKPPDIPRAARLVHVVNRWLQNATPATRYSEYFSGMAETTAMMSVGTAKSNVESLDYKLRNDGSIGGWWPATINSLKAARELVQIMSGEKKIEQTEFNEISKSINHSVVTTPLLIGAAALAPPALVAGAEAIPALPATIQGVSTATWGQAAFGATVSSTYLGHVYTRSVEASESGKGSNPFSIAAAAVLDTSGTGKIIQSVTNRSLLTDEDLHQSASERFWGGLTGSVELGMNAYGAADLAGPSPGFEPPKIASKVSRPTPAATTANTATDAGETVVASSAKPALTAEATPAPVVEPVKAPIAETPLTVRTEPAPAVKAKTAPAVKAKTTSPVVKPPRVRVAKTRPVVRTEPAPAVKGITSPPVVEPVQVRAPETASPVVDPVPVHAPEAPSPVVEPAQVPAVEAPSPVHDEPVAAEKAGGKQAPGVRSRRDALTEFKKGIEDFRNNEVKLANERVTKLEAQRQKANLDKVKAEEALKTAQPEAARQVTQRQLESARIRENAANRELPEARANRTQANRQLADFQRQAERAEAEISGVSHWQTLDVHNASDDELALYGELKTTARLQEKGLEVAGTRTRNPRDVLTRGEWETALSSHRGQQGIDGVYKQRLDDGSTKWWAGDAKTTGQVGRPPRPTGRGKLELTADGYQLSKNWLLQRASRAGLSPAEMKEFQEAIESGSVGVFYAQVYKDGVRFYEVESVGLEDVRIGDPIAF